MGIRGPREKGPLDLLDWVSRSWAEGHHDSQGQEGSPKLRPEAPCFIKTWQGFIDWLVCHSLLLPKSGALSDAYNVHIPAPSLGHGPIFVCWSPEWCSDHVCWLSKHDPGDDISNLVYKQLQIRPREKETLTGARRVCKKIMPLVREPGEVFPCLWVPPVPWYLPRSLGSAVLWHVFFFFPKRVEMCKSKTQSSFILLTNLLIPAFHLVSWEGTKGKSMGPAIKELMTWCFYLRGP